MCDAMATQERLNTAIHLSVPPAIFIVLANALVVSKTLRLFKVIGSALPARLMALLRKLYVVFNMLFVASACGFLVYNCPGAIRFQAELDATCIPACSLLAVLMLVLLWADRVALNALDAPSASESTIFKRAARGAAIVGMLMALHERSAFAVHFAVLSLSNRHSGSVRLAWLFGRADTLIRLTIAYTGLRGMITADQSQRLSVFLVLCAVHAR